MKNKLTRATMLAALAVCLASAPFPTAVAASWSEAGAEIEKAAVSETKEQELAFLSKAAAMVRNRDGSLFAQEASQIREEIKKLEFSVLQGVSRADRAADYEALKFRLDLVASGDECAAQTPVQEEAGPVSPPAFGLREPAGSKSAPPAIQEKGPFITHLSDALRINRERGEYYSSRTAGASRLVSLELTAMEKVTLPLAWIIDRRAAKFNRAGIPVIKGDFVPMSGIAKPETPPLFRNGATSQAVAELRAALGSFGGSVKNALKADDFTAICVAADAALSKIGELENSGRCHFAMSKHIVESIGFAALHAPEYARLSGGKTAGLSKFFIRVQAMALMFCHKIDLSAQKVHALGVGILVNDLPLIPFAAEWKGRAK